MAAHRPLATARRHATSVAQRIGGDVDLARRSLGLTITQVARRAGVARSTVVRVIHGDGGVHVDTLCAVAAAVGLNIGIKAYPAAPPSLRDTGQMTIAQGLIARANSSLKPALEVAVGDLYGRAADLVFYCPDEILHIEIERYLLDFQATFRGGSLKREALQKRHSRPVRLILAVEDTRRNRQLLQPHEVLIRTALPKHSRAILRVIRDGTALGGDGLLWVRPWRSHIRQVTASVAVQ